MNWIKNTFILHLRLTSWAKICATSTNALNHAFGTNFGQKFLTLKQMNQDFAHSKKV